MYPTNVGMGFTKELVTFSTNGWKRLFKKGDSSPRVREMGEI